MATHRTIIESDRFKAERHGLNPEVQRWDEVLRGISWGLCQNPGGVGQNTDAGGIYAIPTQPWPGAPAVVVYYEFDNDTVTLLSIVHADPLDT